MPIHDASSASTPTLSDTSDLESGTVTRRDFLRSAGALTAMAGLQTLLPGWAHAGGGAPAGGLTALEPTRRDGTRVEYDITIDRTPFAVKGKRGTAITMNGTVPGPLIRLQEGEEVVLRYHNELDEETSIHWHGLLLPNRFDGVPKVNYPGVAPGETFEAGPFEVRQYGTYWYHSHSGLQEQLGHYGPLVIDPAEPDPFSYERDYAVVLSDWTFDDPAEIMRNLKVAEGYYNYNQRTVADFFADVENMGWQAAWQKSAMWGQMRMTPRDILDVTGAEYTYLINGKASSGNWTGLFKPGQTLRL